MNSFADIFFFLNAVFGKTQLDAKLIGNICKKKNTRVQPLIEAMNREERILGESHAALISQYVTNSQSCWLPVGI